MGDSRITAADDDDDDPMAADTKVEIPADGTPSSIESTPEPDVAAESNNQEPAPPQKRKGGRKPIYATSEERKQRNRQAQAAFRERRTEYIKQLEATIKQNEDTLSNLQQSHRTAADECLMLRYKNSLLERILLEKGIDVHTELQMKTGSPLMGMSFSQTPTGVSQLQQSQLQRAAVERQHARRSAGQKFLPKLAPGQSHADLNFHAASPQGVPTPSSHASSPTNVPVRSPLNVQQGAMTPPATAILGQQGQSFAGYQRVSQPHASQPFFPSQQQSPNVNRRPAGPSQHQSTASVHSNHSGTSQYSMNPSMASGVTSTNTGMTQSSASTYYPSPFQKHIDQLEQEYDTEQRSMLDPDSDTSPNQTQRPFSAHYDQQRHASGNQQYYQQQQAPQQAMQNTQAGMAPPNHFHASAEPSANANANTGGMNDSFEAVGQAIDPSDPMLDADPFGLSASMHYPTSYSAMHERAQPH